MADTNCVASRKREAARMECIFFFAKELHRKKYYVVETIVLKGVTGILEKSPGFSKCYSQCCVPCYDQKRGFGFILILILHSSEASPRCSVI